VLKEQGLAEEAVASYRHAVKADPLFAEANNNLGNMLMTGGETEAAVECFQRALEIAPDFAAAHNNLGITLAGQGKLAEAMASLERALELDPGHGEAAAGLLLLYQRACWWEAMAALGSKVDAATATAIAVDRQPGETPFLNMTRCDDPAVNFDVARLWSRGVGRRAAALGTVFERPPGRAENKKITLGYLSSDYRNHPVGHLIGGLFAEHDRERFEVYAYSSGDDDASAYRR
jgi:protein O-GlcNAc transferase